MPSWKKLILSGSDASLNSLAVATSVTAQSFTGSLFGTASWAINAQTASYATNFNVSQSLTASGLVYPTADNGEESFIQTDGAGTLSLQYVKTIYEEVYNGEATTIVKGTPVYVSGSVGATATVFRADAGSPAKMPVVYITADTIASGATGRGIALGLIKGVDTTGYPAGTEIFVGVGGGWTSTRPTGSAIVQVLGYVTKEGSGGQGVVLNPGPAELPNLQTSYLWVGDSDYYPVAIATSSIQNVVSSSYALSSSYTVSSSYALNATSASGVNGGTPNYLTVWKTNTQLSSSGFYQDPNNNNYVGLFTTLPTYSLDVNGTVRAQGDLRGQVKVYFPNLTDGSPSTEVVIWDSAQGQLFHTASAGLSVATASYVLNAVSASYAATASSADNFLVRGNLGVGTTPSYRLDVSGSANFVLGNSGSLRLPSGAGQKTGFIQSAFSNFLFSSNVYYDGTNWRYDQNGYGAQVQTETGVEGAINFNTFDTGIAGNIATLQNRLKVLNNGNIGVNNTNPVYKFDVSGSTNIEGSLTVTGSLYLSSSLHSAQGNTAASATTTVIVSVTTGSYTAGFFDYTVASGSNARAGTVASVWNDASVQFTDNSTLDIGSTSAVTMSVNLSGANVRLVAGSTSGNWTVKSTYRLI